MKQNPDLTFTVRPRPAEAAGKPGDAVLDLSSPAGPPPPGNGGKPEPDGRDTLLANLAFLVRFAFGRY